MTGDVELNDSSESSAGRASRGTQACTNACPDELRQRPQEERRPTFPPYGKIELSLFAAFSLSGFDSSDASSACTCESSA